MTRPLLFALLALMMSLAMSVTLPASARAQDAPPIAAPTTPVAAQSLPLLDTSHFDAAKATEKYLSRVSGAARAKSDAYFEGGYWLQLVDLLYSLVVAGLLLGLRISVGIRDWAADRTRNRTGQVMLYVIAYALITTAAALPLNIYEGFIREHAYGLSNQNFWQWLSDFGINFGVSLVTLLIAIPILYAIIRAAREAWWAWGTVLAVLFLVAEFVVFPVWIAPLTNHYAPLPDSPLKTEILSLARANDVPVNNVYVVDESRQSSRISANVSGFLGTARISLNDNLLHQGTHDEILAVLGHEMGHYVMDHNTRIILLMGLVIGVGFLFANWGFQFACGLFGGFWNVRRLDDVAGLPLLMALASLYFFVMTPVNNSIIRTIEHQADIFGLDAVRKPDAFATVALKLSSYRKLDPGKWEEIIFYDHPSGRERIQAAMTWKAAHIADPDISNSASLP